jgi:dUTP pyrophosphatase
MINVKKVHPDAKLPLRNKATDAGADLFSVENDCLMPGERKFIDTGIAIQASNFDFNGFTSYFRVAPRSGNAFNYGIDVLAGVIDNGYTGNIKVGLLNTGKDVFDIRVGDKIAQLIREIIIIDNFQFVDQLNETERSDAGFGSSGV